MSEWDEYIAKQPLVTVTEDGTVTFPPSEPLALDEMTPEAEEETSCGRGDDEQ